MSDVFHDPVGDRLRAHDLQMRKARWEHATSMVVALIVGLTVVGVMAGLVYLFTGNKPRYATGITSQGTPWCETYDERPCPVFRPEAVAAQPAKPGYILTWPSEAKQ